MVGYMTGIHEKSYTREGYGRAQLLITQQGSSSTGFEVFTNPLYGVASGLITRVLDKGPYNSTEGGEFKHRAVKVE